MNIADLDPELLISTIQKRPVLWDISRKDYKSRSATAEAWRETCEELNPDFESLLESEQNEFGRLIVKRWRNIKDQYIKTIKRIKAKTGLAAKRAKKYVFHKQLSFLKATLDMKEAKLRSGIDLNSSSQVLLEVKKDSEDSLDEHVSFVATTPEKCLDEVSSTKISTSKPPTKRKRTDSNEREVMDYLFVDEEGETLTKEDRHLLFFKSILPSLKDFTDDDTLQLQSTVISVIQNIKKARAIQAQVSPVTPSCISGPHRQVIY